MGLGGQSLASVTASHNSQMRASPSVPAQGTGHCSPLLTAEPGVSEPPPLPSHTPRAAPASLCREKAPNAQELDTAPRTDLLGRAEQSPPALEREGKLPVCAELYRAPSSSAMSQVPLWGAPPPAPSPVQELLHQPSTPFKGQHVTELEKKAASFVLRHEPAWRSA